MLKLKICKPNEDGSLNLKIEPGATTDERKALMDLEGLEVDIYAAGRWPITLIENASLKFNNLRDDIIALADKYNPKPAEKEGVLI
jgi:hypothetical protein